MVKKSNFSALWLTLSCAIVAFCIVGLYNNYSILLGSWTLYTNGAPENYEISDGPCTCSLFHSSPASKPNLTCSCSNQIEACPPMEKIVETQLPPLEEIVREVIKVVSKPDLSAQLVQKIVEEEKQKIVEEEKEKKAEVQPIIQNVQQVVRRPWYAEDRTWHYPAMFPLCSMDICFNFSRCTDMDEVKVFSYNLPSPPVRYFSRINETRYHTNDPDKACLFFVYLDGPGPWYTHPRDLPYWNNGLNHVLILFADMWRQKGPPQDTIGMASVMISDIHETIYRAGFDISIPLPGVYHSQEFQTINAFDRKYFLTFRGLRYFGRNGGEGVFRSHESFRALHNGKDIIVATSCKHAINDLIRAKDPELGQYCDEDEKIHAATSFRDLMNTTFGLVPAGVQPNSYRFIEVMSTGAIPVLIADNYVKPFDTLIIWHKCLVQFPTTEMHRIVDSLRGMKREEVEKRKMNCLEIYKEFLINDEALLKASMRSLKARFMGVFPKMTELRK